MLLQNKNAVITGCNRGIGQAILEVFVKNGANAWACSRNADDQEQRTIWAELAAQHDRWIEPIALDLGDDESISQCCRTIARKKVPIDIIVNNAGIIDTSLFAMTPMNKLIDMFTINFFSQMSLTQKLIRPMIKQKSGSIINLSSSAAIEANEGRLSYAASKSALITATRVMSRELGSHNIRANVIAPGLTETDMMKSSTPTNVLEATLSRISLQRVAQPNEIANTALFLGSDLASYITGQVISVDGGM